MGNFARRWRHGIVITCLAAILMGGLASNVEAATAEERVLALINKHRAKAGCAPLVMQMHLMRAAKGHSSDMAENDFYGHASLDGRMPDDRARAAGYQGGYIGENIAAGQQSASEVVAAWMRSPGHRAAILNCGFAETGISLTKQSNDRPIDGNPAPFFTYWVNIFGHP